MKTKEMKPNHSSTFSVRRSRFDVPLRPPSLLLLFVLLLASDGRALATVHYVDATNAAPAPPYTN
jgi:hypothetical protein